jgi:hypothetical protein
MTWVQRYLDRRAAEAVLAAVMGCKASSLFWRAIETDRFPHAPRLDPLRSALAKLEPAGSKANPAEGPAARQSQQAGAALTRRRPHRAGRLRQLPRLILRQSLINDVN